MASFENQGAISLRKVQEILLPRAMKDRELLKLMPFQKVDEVSLIYERRQVVTGRQWARGDMGPTGPVKKPGIDAWPVEPGMYGDHYLITEKDLIKLREAGKWDSWENYDKQEARGAMHLTQRYLDRVEDNIAQMLMNGILMASNVSGTAVDVQVFKTNQYAPSVLFDQLATATPLKYLRNLIPKLELGLSVSMRKGFILLSRPTLNLILNNANSADFYGRRADYGATFNNVEDLNEFQAGNELPPFKVYDAGYYSDPPSGAPVFNRFLTNGKLVFVGQRTDGEPIGEYRLTRTAQNPNSAPGDWYSVQDLRQHEPFSVILRQGHNGGPVPYYPEALATVTVAPSNSSEFA